MFLATISLARARESALIVADSQVVYVLRDRNIEHRFQIGSLATIATAMVTLDWRLTS
ncbi:MAG: hypothetical protein JMM79_03400 [Candidatus Xiphinematobacter sp.]|nr:MAG: hypothetical protein JMM79_03400 [Candidatus Xiphinematobacter sp.]